ncbi:hypothetical protein SAMN05444166_6520 [Singulisphaera sp. GP187]|uniref:hypothetical protein n=1 Tax=Singulisphaera sp. GP187 TaxID=1882752 RepID=UPI0009263DD5|nr:hypothetical protein [Singulisphaera sp. GP187]SIO60780.1 hypothetical protein SAMN05444166_6520 [Singulisphaera sp. GP187]
MSEPEREASVEEQAERLVSALGRQTLGREMTAGESAAMATILKAAVQALKHGFIQRLAEQVTAERETETVEEFFENIKPD